MVTTTHGPQADVTTTKVPSRLDRLPWSRWHWMVLIGLGTVWILDGLEVTIVGAVGSTLTKPGSGISITTAQIGVAASIYIAGAAVGALFFGYLTDRLGRKRLFLVTLCLYLVATVLTAFSVTAVMFFVFRFFTGMGIGGEYAAINSAIDELIPARVRGTVDLIVNGSYWLGTAAGAAATLVLLDPSILALNVGWRVCFFMGAVLGLAVLLVRRTLPESPRWLLTHGRADEAEAVVDDIERTVTKDTGQTLAEPEESIEVRDIGTVGLLTMAHTIFAKSPRRSVLGLSLFIGQAFLYNAVFFTYSLVLSTFYNVSSDSIGYYLIAFALGNFLGPLLLGRLFDVVGRRVMISGCYIASGAMLMITAWLFDQGVLSATTQTVAWVVIFFFASAGASAAYLTVSEIFPMETRALAIAFFFAVGTGIGGIIGPSLFGNLIATKKPSAVAMGYVIGGALMLGAGLVEVFLGVDAEQRALEDIASPLSEAEGHDGGPARTRQGISRLPRQNRPYPYPTATGRFGGYRLYRPTFTAPGQAGRSPTSAPTATDGEVAKLVEALAQRNSAMSTRELAALSGSRFWGPGRLRAALAQGVATGQLRRITWDRYVLGPRAEQPGQTHAPDATAATARPNGAGHNEGNPGSAPVVDHRGGTG